MTVDELLTLSKGLRDMGAMEVSLGDFHVKFEAPLVQRALHIPGDHDPDEDEEALMTYSAR